jgi:hypothetical protein
MVVTYLDVQAVRMDARLSCSIDIADGLQALQAQLSA